MEGDLITVDSVTVRESMVQLVLAATMLVITEFVEALLQNISSSLHIAAIITVSVTHAEAVALSVSPAYSPTELMGDMLSLLSLKAPNRWALSDSV